MPSTKRQQLLPKSALSQSPEPSSNSILQFDLPAKNVEVSSAVVLLPQTKTKLFSLGCRKIACVGLNKTSARLINQRCFEPPKANERLPVGAGRTGDRDFRIPNYKLNCFVVVVVQATRSIRSKSAAASVRLALHVKARTANYPAFQIAHGEPWYFRSTYPDVVTRRHSAQVVVRVPAEDMVAPICGI